LGKRKRRIQQELGENMAHALHKEPKSQQITAETREMKRENMWLKQYFLKEKTKSTKRPWKFQRQTMKHIPI
jgi:hypothetical protein